MRSERPGTANDVLTVEGARVRVDDETDAVLLQFAVSDRRPEGEGPSVTSWLSIPRGLVPDLVALLDAHADPESGG